MLHSSCMSVRMCQNQKCSCPGYCVVKSQYSQLHPSAPPAVPALSAHVLQFQRSPQPILAALDPGRWLSPADSRGGCSGSAGGIGLYCFVWCCLGPSASPLVPPTVVCCETQMLSAQWLLFNHRYFSRGELGPLHGIAIHAEYMALRFFPPDHSQDSEQKCGNVGQNTLPVCPVLCCCVHPSTSWLKTKVLL